MSSVAATETLPGKRQDAARFEVGTLPYLVPAAALMAVLFLGPIVYSLYLAFTNLQLAGPNAVHYQFTGLTNVHRLFQDTEFSTSTKLTVIFLVGSAIVGQTMLGMVLALLMRRALSPIRIVVGAFIVLAWVLPEVTAAFVWYAFSQPGGTLGAVLHQPSTNYLQTLPMWMVCIANAWRNVAFSMLMFSAALRNLPTEVLEAAEIEGAGMFRRMFYVVLPMMRGTITTNLLLVTLGNLSTFTLIWVLTQGGPGDATSILPVYMYLVSFSFSDLGYGSMIGLALITLGALFSVVYVYSLRARVA
jgi:multiple sugar transport system permease protein